MAEFDDISDRILRELERDGRLSNVALAERVGLSPSACLRRVQELERTGVIAGYRAIVDRGAMRNKVVVYVTVGLSDHSKASQQAFDAVMEKAAAVRESYNISGSVEYLLRVEVPDLADYKAFHTDILGTLPQVNKITSYFVMDEPKNER